jgi:hypothetical protein
LREGLGMADGKSFQSVLAGWIGGLTILWKDCQAAIYMMFHEALDTDILKSQAVFFTLRSDGTQRDVTAALLKVALYLHPELADKAIRAINDFGRIAGKRNDFIHAIWHFPPGSDAGKVWMDVRKNLKGKDPIEEIKKLIAELEAMFLTLTEIRIEVEKTLKAPKNMLAAALIPGLLGEQPPLSDEQRASLTRALQQDEPEALPPPRPASDE